jgi:hypothetical protein
MRKCDMRLLDNAAIVSALATSTGKPHMLLEATRDGVETLRSLSPAPLDADVVDALAQDGCAVVAFSSFVDGALGFHSLEQRILAEKVRGVSLRLVQSDGKARIHEALSYPVVAMPLRRAA